MNKLSYKIALGGVVASVCLMFMFMTSVFPLLAMAIPIYTGALLVIVAVEINSSWAMLTYMSVAFLSLFVTPDKEAAVIFIMFFGYYPILRRILEDKVRLRPIKWICKFAVFNAAIAVSYYIIFKVFGLYSMTDEFGFLGEHMILILLCFANAVFIMYDFTISRLEIAYVKWFRKVYLRKK